jgi:DNA-directed RNA polymerase specialized sigma subunit
MTVSELRHNIDERVFSERDRLILKLRYIDGLTYDGIANDKRIVLEVRQIRRICKKYENRIYKGLKCPYIDH